MKTDDNILTLSGILTIVVASALMFGSIPFAFAAPDASMSCDAAVAGGVTNCRVSVGGATGNLPIRADPSDGEIAVYNIPLASLTEDICPLDSTLAAGESRWTLVRDGGGVSNDGKPIGYEFPAPSATCDGNCGIKFKFPGDIVGSSQTVVTRTQTATIFVIGGTETGLTSANAKWVKTAGPGPVDPATAVATAGVVNNIGSCGDESVLTPFDTQWEEYANWGVVKPVGGSIMSVNVSALLIAGAFTTGLWILPVLGISSISGYYLYRNRVKLQ